MSNAKAKIVTRNVAPRFTHDCDACRFLGNLDGQDLYVCKDGSLIRRTGNEGPDYGSIPGDMPPPKGSPYSLARVLAGAVDHECFEPRGWRTMAPPVPAVCNGCEDCDGEGGHAVPTDTSRILSPFLARKVQEQDAAKARASVRARYAHEADDYSNSLTYSATERAPFAPPVSRRRRA